MAVKREGDTVWRLHDGRTKPKSRLRHHFEHYEPSSSVNNGPLLSNEGDIRRCFGSVEAGSDCRL